MEHSCEARLCMVLSLFLSFCHKPFPYSTHQESCELQCHQVSSVSQLLIKTVLYIPHLNLSALSIDSSFLMYSQNFPMNEYITIPIIWLQQGLSFKYKIWPISLLKENLIPSTICCYMVICVAKPFNVYMVLSEHR